MVNSQALTRTPNQIVVAKNVLVPMRDGVIATVGDVRSDYSQSNPQTRLFRKKTFIDFVIKLLSNIKASAETYGAGQRPTT